MPAKLKQSCLDCGGPAWVIGARLLVDGRRRRSHRCKLCGATFKTYTSQVKQAQKQFGKWLCQKVKHPPRSLSTLALFDETVVLWREAKQ